VDLFAVVVDRRVTVNSIDIVAKIERMAGPWIAALTAKNLEIALLRHRYRAH
jgi:hypothetical protein